MRVAQIVKEPNSIKAKATWVFECDVMPQFADNIVLIDITDNPNVSQNWLYDPSTGAWEPPTPLNSVLVVPEPVDMMNYQSLIMKAAIDIYLAAETIKQQQAALDAKIASLNAGMVSVKANGKTDTTDTTTTTPELTTDATTAEEKTLGIDDAMMQLIVDKKLKLQDVPRSRRNKMRKKLWDSGFDETGRRVNKDLFKIGG
jgi:hypothetical protein